MGSRENQASLASSFLIQTRQDCVCRAGPASCLSHFFFFLNWLKFLQWLYSSERAGYTRLRAHLFVLFIGRKGWFFNREKQIGKKKSSHRDCLAFLVTLLRHQLPWFVFFSLHLSERCKMKVCLYFLLRTVRCVELEPSFDTAPSLTHSQYSRCLSTGICLCASDVCSCHFCWVLM